MRQRLLTTALLGLLCVSGWSSNAMAADDDGWSFEVTPYLLAAGLDGTVGISGVTGDIDVGFDDILEDLDMAFMGIFSAHKGPWSLGAEAIYTKIDSAGASNVTGPFGRVTVNGALGVTTKMTIFQGTVGYRVGDGATKVDLLGGLRYTKLGIESSVRISTTPPIQFLDGSTSAKGSDSWVDAVVGAHASHPIGKNTNLIGYVDVGGGGSDLTWQFIVGLDLAFRDNLVARFGYRYMYWDYEDDGTVWDMALSGPYLGLGFLF